MRKSIYLFGALFIALASSCGSKSSSSVVELAEAIEYYPVQETEDGKWGFADKNGEVLFLDEFKSRPSVVINGFFSVEEKGVTTVYKIGKKPTVLSGCDDLAEAGIMNEGLMPICKKNDRISVVNDKGEAVFTLMPIGGKEITKAFNCFFEGLLPVRNEDNKWGFVDKSGKTIVEPKYDRTGIPSQGLIPVGKEVDEEMRYSVIDRKGEEVFSLKKGLEPALPYFSYGYIVVKDGDNRWGFVDKKGEFYRLPSKVDAVGYFNDKFFSFREDEKWGVMTMDLDEPDVVIKPRYDSIYLLQDGNFIVHDGDAIFILNKEGDKVLKFKEDYKEVYDILGDKAKYVARDGSNLLFIGEDGKPVNKKEFNNISVSFPLDDIYSHYVNVDGIVAEIMKNVTGKGIGKYTVGAPASTIGGEPEDYYSGWSGQTSFEDNSLETSTRDVMFTFYGSTDYPISEYFYEYDSEGYSSSVLRFNPASRIDGLLLKACLQEDVWKEVKPKLFESIKAKGFSLESDMGSEAEFSNGDVSLDVSYSSECITLNMLPKRTPSASAPAFPTDSIASAMDTIQAFAY